MSAQRPLAQRRRSAATSNSRAIAYEVLQDVADRDAYANLALAAKLRSANLSAQNAAFVTELVAGTLRLMGRYDRIIELAAKRSVDSIDDAVLNVLRLGAHQLLGMRTPTHAALFETVELGKRVAGARVSGFVNGVLRTISRTDSDEWGNRIRSGAKSPEQAFAHELSHPQWIVEKLGEALAHDRRPDELRVLLEADNMAPAVQLTVLSNHDPAEIVADERFADLGLTAKGVSPRGIELAQGNPAHAIEALAAAGVNVRVQDQGSALMALALVGATEVQPGERWLDLCAGPGGKAAMLAAEAKRRGATLRANEVSAHRAKLVKQSLAAFPEVMLSNADGRVEQAYAGEAYDRILIDAPCSGIGALRRRPEARWRKQAEDLSTLVPLQQELLDAATSRLRPGGVIAYVTCSPLIEETTRVVQRHLERNPDLRMLEAREVLLSVARPPFEVQQRADATAQLWPHSHGTDAMFIALMQRGDEPQSSSDETP